MLTVLRPKTPQEEEFFTKWCHPHQAALQYLFDQIRLVDLNKLKISTRKLEAEILLKNNGVDPDITEKNAAKSLGGVIVKTFQVYIFFLLLFNFFKF